MPENQEDNQEKIRALFNSIDKDDNDTIEWDEFCSMIDELVADKTLDEKTRLFAEIDTNNTGMISFEEFCEWWKKYN